MNPQEEEMNLQEEKVNLQEENLTLQPGIPHPLKIGKFGQTGHKN